jgi:DNA invertase Pin-like site-specific DNA recombinase
MLGVFSELERALIQERVKAGIARARAQGKHLGRPRINGRPSRRSVPRSPGKGIRKVARECGVGVSCQRDHHTRASHHPAVDRRSRWGKPSRDCPSTVPVTSVTGISAQ